MSKESWSIKYENLILTVSPMVSHSKSSAVIGWLPPLRKALNKIKDTTKEATAEATLITPAALLGILRKPKPLTKKPTKGKSGTKAQSKVSCIILNEYGSETAFFR